MAPRDARRVLEARRSGRADPVATAERWARTDLALRLRCIENWLTERIRRQFAGATFSVEVRPAPHLQRGACPEYTRALPLTDAVRELRRRSMSPSIGHSRSRVLFRHAPVKLGGLIKGPGEARIRQSRAGTRICERVATSQGCSRSPSRTRARSTLPSCRSSKTAASSSRPTATIAWAMRSSCCSTSWARTRSCRSPGASSG